MRCKGCNRIYRPTMKRVSGQVVFNPLCSKCYRGYDHNYAYSHEFYLNQLENPRAIIAREGCLAIEEVYHSTPPKK